MSSLKPELIFFWPNLRTEKATATTGYTWGKPVPDSNILAELQPAGFSAQKLQLAGNDVVAERWLVSDDRELGSWVMDPISQQKKQPFFQLLEEFGEQILGRKHHEVFGPYLGCVMKQLDTHSSPLKGSLSVQVHPKPGHPSRPAKPEMWQGQGNVYLGWNRSVTESEIREAYHHSTLEQLLNPIELTPDKLVLVKGGMIHAIRFNTFAAEWSMAPGAADSKKGNLKDATHSPYDRTDGKTPRPGKEDLEATLELLRSYEDGFTAVDKSQLFHTAVLLTHDDLGNNSVQLFETDEVVVREHTIMTSYDLSLAERGTPLFVKSGKVVVRRGDQNVAILTAGQEVFVPAFLEEIVIIAQEPTVIQQWEKPLSYG